MKTITIELDDEYYTRFEQVARNLGKTVNGYAKQVIENKTDSFNSTGFRVRGII